MKAEEKVRKFMYKKYPTNKYWACPVPEHHWEIIQEYADQYAKDQIQKDRERVLEQIYEDDGAELISTSFKNTPIILE